ncbi:aldehyde-activating protein [Actibacterium sp. 188UL27-1]|nr:aldehyde-activating protein [Actibacterium sp. 188UL27-1]
MAFHSCATCGATTHWAMRVDPGQGKIAVNLMLADPEVINQVPVRHFDGAETWTFLEDDD